MLVALAILLWGVTWLKQVSFARKMDIWHIRFSQAGGVGKGDEVQVNGIRKGEVGDVRLQGDHVVIDLALESDVRLTDRSRVVIRDLGVMGDKVVYVSLGEGGRPYAPRDTLSGYYEKGIAEVMAELGDAVSSVTAITRDMQQVTASARGDGDLAVTVRNFRATSEELRRMVMENRTALRTTIQNFSDASSATRRLTTDREAELKRTFEDLGRAAENMNRLSARLDSLRGSLQTVSGRLERGEGTLGKLVNDDQVYTELRSSLDNLNALLADIKKNPKKYFKFSVF